MWREVGEYSKLRKAVKISISLYFYQKSMYRNHYQPVFLPYFNDIYI